MDGVLTWASITAGHANAHELNRLFQETQPLFFVILGALKATLSFLVFGNIRQVPISKVPLYALLGSYVLLDAWNLGNLAVNL